RRSSDAASTTSSPRSSAAATSSTPRSTRPTSVTPSRNSIDKTPRSDAMRNDTFLTRSDRLGLNPRRIGMTYYSIQHVTRFEYDTAVRESIMEVRMAPRDEGPQSVASFELRTYPRAEVRRHL